MSEKYRHVLLPALMPLVFFMVALTPVNVLGCRTRGILALVIAIASGAAGIATSAIALRQHWRGVPGSESWVISTLILTIPLFALLYLA